MLVTVVFWFDKSQTEILNVNITGIKNATMNPDNLGFICVRYMQTLSKTSMLLQLPAFLQS